MATSKYAEWFWKVFTVVLGVVVVPLTGEPTMRPANIDVVTPLGFSGS